MKAFLSEPVAARLLEKLTIDARDELRGATDEAAVGRGRQHRWQGHDLELSVHEWRQRLAKQGFSHTLVGDDGSAAADAERPLLEVGAQTMLRSKP